MNFRNFSDSEKKNLKFWNNRVRYKGKIFTIKRRSSADGSYKSRVAKALTEVERPGNLLKLKEGLESSATNEDILAKSMEVQYKADKIGNEEDTKNSKVNVNLSNESKVRTYESSTFDQVNVNLPIKFGTKDYGFIMSPNWRPPGIQQEEGDD